MRRVLFTVGSAVLLAGSGPSPAEAQMGVIIDWIGRLSGPMFQRGGVTYVYKDGDYETRALGSARGRVTLMAGSSVKSDDQIDPDGSVIKILSVQTGVELFLKEAGVFEGGVELGAALHRFFGDVDSFWHPSFPILAVVYLGVPRARLRVSGGVHLFPPFGADDFQPLRVTVDRGELEVVPTFAIGFEFRYRTQ